MSIITPYYYAVKMGKIREYTVAGQNVTGKGLSQLIQVENQGKRRKPIQRKQHFNASWLPGVLSQQVQNAFFPENKEGRAFSCSRQFSYGHEEAFS